MSVSATSSSATSSGAAVEGDTHARAANRFGTMLVRAGSLVWLWPALLTLGLGLYKADTPLLWADELATWNAANRSPHQLYDMLQHVDAVTGLYYYLIHYWTAAFGHSLLVIRIPTVLAMAGAAAFVALTGRKLFGARTGLVAGVLFALIPSVSRYAQEVRGYAFVVFFAAAATYLLMRALERPTTWPWVLYTVALLGAGSFHMIALVFLAPHALITAWRWWTTRDKRLLIGFPAAVLAGLLPLVPLVLEGQKQVGRQLNWLAKPSLEDVPTVFWHGLYGSQAVSLGMLALAVLPLAWTRGRRHAVELGLVAVLPIALLWIISQGQTSYFIDRYMLFTLPAWAVLAGAGLTALRPRALTAGGLILVLLLGSHEQLALRQKFSHTEWDGAAAAAVIAKGYQPGDGLVPLRNGNAILSGVVSAVDFYLPQQDKLKDVFVATSAIDRGDLYPQMCTDLAACLGDTKRVWVVTIGWWDPFNGFSPEERKVLTSAFPKRTVTQVPNAVVTLLER